MGLVDVDKLKDADCKMCQFCLTDSKGIKDIEGCREMGCGVMQLYDRQPTIEAIPTEQVASMLKTIAQNTCPIEVIGMDKTEWCIEQNCFDRFFNENCWLHALKEGWLDE